MGLFDFFKRRKAPDVQLPEALIDAAHREDWAAFSSLCTRHRDEIFRMLPSWQVTPPEIRNDPAALDRYCKGLIAVASYFENAGDSRLIDFLVGDEAENPIILWRRDLDEAKRMIDAGDAAKAVELMLQVLERTEGLRAGSVAELRPRTLGTLGVAYFKAGDNVRALQFTREALEMCQAVGDEDGARTYKANLAHIQGAH